MVRPKLPDRKNIISPFSFFKQHLNFSIYNLSPLVIKVIIVLFDYYNNLRILDKIIYKNMHYPIMTSYVRMHLHKTYTVLHYGNLSGALSTLKAPWYNPDNYEEALTPSNRME